MIFTHNPTAAQPWLDAKRGWPPLVIGIGTEAIYKLTVKDFPVTVIIDNQGNDLYAIGKAKYKR